MQAELKKVAIIGAGAMGGGIAEVCATAGFETILVDVKPGQAKKAKEDIKTRLEKRIAKGKLDDHVGGEIRGRITAADKLDAIRGAGLVIEAIVEDAEIKKNLFEQIEAIVPDHAVIATNTSSLSVNKLAKGLQSPARFAGLHFFNPAAVMALVEVVRSDLLAPDALDTLLTFSRACGKTPVLVKDSPGFIVNRVARPFYGEALRLLEEEVADVEAIDACLQAGLNVPMGPFALMDFIGLDINLAATEGVWKAFDQHPRYEPSALLREKVERGNLGRKTGQGFYCYPLPDEDLALLPRPEDVLGILSDMTGYHIAYTDGRTAEKTSANVGKPVVLLDRAMSFSKHHKKAAFAFATSGISETDQNAIKEIFRSKGIEAYLVKDTPGLVCLRVASTIINEAMFAVDEEIASLKDIDISMKMGLRFGSAVLDWRDAFDPAAICQTLAELHVMKPSGRYKAAESLINFKGSRHEG